MGREVFDERRLVERILLASWAHGLGAGIGWLSFYVKAEQAKALLGIPSERFVRTAIALAYPAASSETGRLRRARRKPLIEFVDEERNGVPFGASVTQELCHHDAVMLIRGIITIDEQWPCA